MKTIFRSVFLCISLLAPALLGAQAVSINTDASSPDPSAILDVKSTDKGMLVPRMSTAQRAAIAAPATGLLVYDTDSQSFWFYNGTAWANLSGGGGGAPASYIADADGNTKVQVEKNTNEDIIRMDLAGDEVLVLKKNNPTGNHLMIDLPDNSENTFLGHNAGLINKTGSINTFIGNGSGQNLETGINNTFLGAFSGLNTTSGNENVFIGANAGKDHSTQGGNTFIGSFAGAGNISGFGNVFIGYEVGSLETGSNKLYIDNTNAASPLIYGEFDNNLLRINGTLNINNAFSLPATDGSNGQFLSTNGSGAVSWASPPVPAIIQDADADTKIQVEETANDNQIRLDLAGSERVVFRRNATGGSTTMIELPNNSSNVFMGNSAGLENISGSSNVYLGTQAGEKGTTSNFSTCIGGGAGRSLTNGFINTIVGYAAGSEGTTGIQNTLIGGQSGKRNNGSYNTMLGQGAGEDNINGSSNVYIGQTAGQHNNGSNNVFIGHQAGVDLTGQNDILFIENSNGSIPLIWGNFSTNLLGINRVATTNTLEVEGEASKSSAGNWLANSDACLKKNITPLNSREMLDKLLSLRGVTYEWNDDKTGWKRPGGIQYGFTAQNIQAVFPTLVSEDKTGYLQTAYGTYDAMMVEAIRALNEEITNLKSENTAQAAEIGRLKNVEAQLVKITAALQSAGIPLEQR